MSEYILDEKKVMRHEVILPEKLEVIVRCRDCVCLMKHAERLFMMDGSEPTPYQCGRFGGNVGVSLDGFCAWGERVVSE